MEHGRGRFGHLRGRDGWPGAHPFCEKARFTTGE